VLAESLRPKTSSRDELSLLLALLSLIVLPRVQAALALVAFCKAPLVLIYALTPLSLLVYLQALPAVDVFF